MNYWNIQIQDAIHFFGKVMSRSPY